MSNHEEPLRATVRLVADDLKQTLSTIGCEKDRDTDLLFANGVLLARSENSDGFAKQARVRLLEGSGGPMGFRVSNEKLLALGKRGRELKMLVVARDGFSCHVHASETSDVSNDLDWECERLPAESQTPQGKMLPGVILREVLRVVEPFAHNRQRGFLEPLKRVDLIESTRLGLVCRSPEDETVCFEVPGLVETPWVIPVEVLAEVRAFTRNWKSFCVGTDNDRSWIADGQGAAVAWRTRVPVDVDVDADHHERNLDQFVATVRSAKVESALECMKSQLSCADATTVLQISPHDRSVAFEITCRESTYQTSVPIHIERNRLDGEIEARFGLGSLRKVLIGTMGRSVQLRLHCHDEGHRRATWQLRSVDSYVLGGPKNRSGAQPDAQPVLCRVTRMAPSLARGK